MRINWARYILVLQNLRRVVIQKVILVSLMKYFFTQLHWHCNVNLVKQIVLILKKRGTYRTINACFKILSVHRDASLRDSSVKYGISNFVNIMRGCLLRKCGCLIEFSGMSIVFYNRGLISLKSNRIFRLCLGAIHRGLLR